MVDSISNNSSQPNLQQLALLLQQQQAQIAAANASSTNAAQGNGNGTGSAQGVSGTSSATNLVSNPPSIGGDSLLALLQTQQIGTPASGGTATSGGANSQNPFDQALNQISTDLQSGNIAGAQQTLASLEQAQSGQVHGGHGHHHHGGGSGSATTASSSGSSAGGVGGTDSDGDNDGSGSSASSASASSSSAPPTNVVTANNADGSTTTITTNADGTLTTKTTPGTQTASGSSATGSNTLQDLLAALQQTSLV